MGIAVDISVCAIFLIVLIVGWVKGFIGQVSGLLRGIVSFVGAILLTILVLNMLQEFDFYQSFVAITSSWYKSEAMHATITSQEALEAALIEQGGIYKWLAKISGTLYNDMLSLSTDTTPCDTMAMLFGHSVADLISGVVLWVVLFLLLRLVFKGLIGLMKDIVIMPAFRTVDSFVGAVWSTAITHIVLIGVVLGGTEVLLAKFVPATWDKMYEFLQSTTVLYWLHDNNFIGKALAGLLNVALESLPI